MFSVQFGHLFNDSIQLNVNFNAGRSDRIQAGDLI